MDQSIERYWKSKESVRTLLNRPLKGGELQAVGPYFPALFGGQMVGSCRGVPSHPNRCGWDLPQLGAKMQRQPDWCRSVNEQAHVSLLSGPIVNMSCG